MHLFLTLNATYYRETLPFRIHTTLYALNYLNTTILNSEQIRRNLIFLSASCLITNETLYSRLPVHLSFLVLNIYGTYILYIYIYICI